MSFTNRLSEFEERAFFELVHPFMKCSSTYREIRRYFVVRDTEFMHEPYNFEFGCFRPAIDFLRFKLLLHQNVSRFEKRVFSFVRTERAIRAIMDNELFIRNFSCSKDDEKYMRKYTSKISSSRDRHISLRMLIVNKSRASSYLRRDCHAPLNQVQGRSQ